MGSSYSTEKDNDLTILKNIRQFQKDIQKDIILDSTIQNLLTHNQDYNNENIYNEIIDLKCLVNKLSQDIQKLKQSKKDQNEISTSSIQLNNSLSDNEIQNESTEQMIDNIIKAQKGSYCRIKHHKMKYNGGNTLDYCGHIIQQKINHIDIDLANF